MISLLGLIHKANMKTWLVQDFCSINCEQKETGKPCTQASAIMDDYDQVDETERVYASLDAKVSISISGFYTVLPSKTLLIG